jgi:hypothetical protein
VKDREEMYWTVLKERENDPDTSRILKTISQHVSERTTWINFLAGGLIVMVQKKFGIWSTHQEAIICTIKALERWFASRKPA